MTALIAWSKKHPFLAAWAVLAVAMVVLLVWEARSVGLLPGQWAALIVATVLVAGACVWIISWDSEEEDEGRKTEDEGRAEEAAPAAESVLETPEEVHS